MCEFRRDGVRSRRRFGALWRRTTSALHALPFFTGFLACAIRRGGDTKKPDPRILIRCPVSFPFLTTRRRRGDKKGVLTYNNDEP